MDPVKQVKTIGRDNMMTMKHFRRSESYFPSSKFIIYENLRTKSSAEAARGLILYEVIR